MSLPTRLLATKLYIPRPRPAMVSRPRLLARLTHGMQGSLTLISAQPGSGKTSLVSEWRASDEGKRFPLAWVSLDEADNDPTRFWSYVIDALETLDNAIGEDARMLLQTFPAGPLESVLTTLVNVIATAPRFADGAVDFALVLDDYHVIETPAIHESLRFLIEHMAPSMHIILASRTDPPLPLARLRVRGQLTELRSEDLSFTPAETLAFLNQTMKLHISAENARILADRTEGWIAGLQLAALSFQGHPDIERLVESFSSDHRYVVDYLVQEVLERQPPEIQDFLQQTAILHRLSVDLCNAVTGRSDARKILNALDESNLFLVSLDQERSWYRYHALFGDFLLKTLKQRSPTEFVNILHQRAALWYEQQGLLADAIQHLFSATAFEDAARLIERAARGLWMRGASRTLQCWLQDLPEQVVRSRPRLSLFFAWTLIAANRIQDAKKQLDDVELALREHLPASPDEEDIQAELTILRATVARFDGDNVQTIELSRRALALLPPDNLILRSITELNLGHGYRLSGDSRTASEAYGRAVTFGREVDNTYIVLLAYSNLLHLQMAEGSLRHAYELFQQTLLFAAEHRGLPILAQTYLRGGELLYEWNRVDEAIAYLQQGIEPGRQQQASKYGVQIYMLLARALYALGEDRRAREALSQAADCARETSLSALTSLVAAQQARLWLLQGNLAEASRWASGVDVHYEAAYARRFEYLTLARIFIARGEAKEVLALLENLRKVAQSNGHTAILIETLLLTARANDVQEQKTLAFTSLERALELCEPEGYIRLFLDEGVPMLQLLKRYLAWKDDRIEPSMRSYLATVLAQNDAPLMSMQSETALAAPSNGMQSQVMIEPLGEREKEVLRYLAAGLSNQAIAGEMIVALSTIKSHLKSIYRKLDVESRTQAVARARDLHLI